MQRGTKTYAQAQRVFQAVRFFHTPDVFRLQARLTLTPLRPSEQTQAPKRSSSLHRRELDQYIHSCESPFLMVK